MDIFRPFPDLELVEVLVRDNVNGQFEGLQVKTGIPDPLHGEAILRVQKTTFTASPYTSVVGLAWLPSFGRFAEECLLIPTARLPEIAIDDADCFRLKFRPESHEPTRLDPYRQRLADLGALIAANIENTSK